MSGSVIPYGEALQHSFEFQAATNVVVTSAPDCLDRVDVSPTLRDPADFHGDPHVHDIVDFGQAFADLIGVDEDPESSLGDRDDWPDEGIIILSDHFDDAKASVRLINALAGQVIAEPNLYDDPVFCEEYREVAQVGFGLLEEHLPEFDGGIYRGIPVSLERAGLVTTRMAWGAEPDAVLDDEVRVVTKRAHPKDGQTTDLMATVLWRDLDDVMRLHKEAADIADFVNPASWASTAALLLSAGSRGSRPDAVIHRSFIATTQGIAFARAALKGWGMNPVFYAVGDSGTLSPDYYLENPAVADAGHMLRHFLPNWYKQ